MKRLIAFCFAAALMTLPPAFAQEQTDKDKMAGDKMSKTDKMSKSDKMSKKKKAKKDKSGKMDHDKMDSDKMEKK